MAGDNEPLQYRRTATFSPWKVLKIVTNMHMHMHIQRQRNRNRNRMFCWQREMHKNETDESSLGWLA